MDARSDFQRRIRGDCKVLRDHITKKLNDINLERCCCIPKSQPGADWRVLLDIVKKDPSKATYKVRTKHLSVSRCNGVDVGSATCALVFA